MHDTRLATIRSGEEPAATIPSDLTERLRFVRDALLTGLVERDVPVRLALIAALAGEHLLMLGPPGTAKSLIARRLHLAFAESTYFERLLTRFTVPEELFGPLSIKGLEEDRYERLTNAYLPTASIAFLDEIFKANSAILNALLTLLNEREFDNGATRIKTPIVAVIGASNELPEGEELDALFDRFLVRLHVGPVSKDAFPSLLALRGHDAPEIPDHMKLTPADLTAAQEAAELVEVPEDVVALVCELRDWCTAQEISVSDRRWRKVLKLLQVSAITNGRSRVSVWDCWLLQHCLWDTPEGREQVHEWYATRVGATAAMDPSRLTMIVVSWEAALKADQESRTQMRDSDGHPLFRTPDGKPTRDTKGPAQARRGSELLFLAPPGAYDRPGHGLRQIQDRTNGGGGYTREELNGLQITDGNRGSYVEFQHWSSRDTYLSERNNWLIENVELSALLEPTRHKDQYVSACLSDMEAMRAVVDSYRSRLQDHIESLEREIEGHLWITADFVQPAAASLAQTRKDVDTLLARVARLQSGFEMLPREGQTNAMQAPSTKKTVKE